jgi:hypothetical protein
MECSVLKQLQAEKKIAWDKWTYLHNPANKDIRGMSTRKSKEEAEKARKEFDELRRNIQIHPKYCESCKKSIGSAPDPL